MATATANVLLLLLVGLVTIFILLNIAGCLFFAFNDPAGMNRGKVGLYARLLFRFGLPYTIEAIFVVALALSLANGMGNLALVLILTRFFLDLALREWIKRKART